MRSAPLKSPDVSAIFMAAITSAGMTGQPLNTSLSGLLATEGAIVAGKNTETGALEQKGQGDADRRGQNRSNA